MIGFYGGFIQGDRYNILLEFADKGSLERYFKKVRPPTTGEDIINFWEGLFKLLGALLQIHSGHNSTALDPSQPLQGYGYSQLGHIYLSLIITRWHQDVKPGNILVTSRSESISSPYSWQFKLADLGISHFKRQISSPEDNTDDDSQGSRTYGLWPQNQEIS